MKTSTRNQRLATSSKTKRKPSHQRSAETEKKAVKTRRKKKKPISSPTLHKAKSTPKIHKKKNPGRSKKQKKAMIKKKLHTTLRDFCLTFLIGISLMSLLFKLTLTMPAVNGYGMTMTLSDQDRLVVSKISTFSRFDLVYFKHPLNGELLIRRVIGLPGEELYYQDDQLFIDGEIKPERFLTAMMEQVKQEGQDFTEDFTLQQVTQRREIPADHYFILGDNRRYTLDSRDFGLVPEENIVGVVKLRVLPLHQMKSF